MGAMTINSRKQLGQWPWAAGRRAQLVKLTFSNSYATGGDTLSAAALGLLRVEHIFPVTGTAKISGVTTVAPTGGYKFTIAGTELAPKVLVTKGAGTPAEETNATDLSAQTFYAIVVGTSG